MKKAVKFLPATAAAVAVMTATNNVVDAFSIHRTTHHQSTTTATKTARGVTTVTTSMNGHGSFCTCYGCTSTGGSIKLSSDRDHPSGCDCPACSSSSSTSIGASEQQPILQKSRFGMTHGSLCDCGFCRQQQRHHHGPGCSCSQCM